MQPQSPLELEPLSYKYIHEALWHLQAFTVYILERGEFINLNER